MRLERSFLKQCYKVYQSLLGCGSRIEPASGRYWGGLHSEAIQHAPQPPLDSRKLAFKEDSTDESTRMYGADAGDKQYVRLARKR